MLLWQLRGTFPFGSGGTGRDTSGILDAGLLSGLDKSPFRMEIAPPWSRPPVPGGQHFLFVCGLLAGVCPGLRPLSVYSLSGLQQAPA